MKNPKSLTQFYIVRHGQSKGNINPTDPNPDPELTDEGRRQVQVTTEKLSDKEFDLIVHSDYIRAVQTAEILNANRNLETESYIDLRERSFGTFYTYYKDDLKNMIDAFYQKLDELEDGEYWDYKHIPDMESEREALDRFLNVLKHLAVKHSGKRILIVGHGNLMRNFLSHLGYAHFKELPPMSFVNAGYIEASTDGEQFFLGEVVGATKRVL